LRNRVHLINPANKKPQYMIKWSAEYKQSYPDRTRSQGIESNFVIAEQEKSDKKCIMLREKKKLNISIKLAAKKLEFF